MQLTWHPWNNQAWDNRHQLIRVAILNKIRIERAYGVPSKIVNHPATEFVAEFVDGIDLRRIDTGVGGGSSRQVHKLNDIRSNWTARGPLGSFDLATKIFAPAG